jgi:hypothetical protein
VDSLVTPCQQALTSTAIAARGRAALRAILALPDAEDLVPRLIEIAGFPGSD